MKVSHFAITASMLLVSGIVLAGYTQPAAVQVFVNPDGSGNAEGDMVTARFAESDVELIGCGVRSFDDGAGGVFETGFCQARMADGSPDGVSGFCNIFNAELLDTLRATSDFSFVTFSWNAFGECTRIGFSTQSFYIPEFRKEKAK